MPKLSADERLQRLLALIPWVASRDGPRMEEVCARFGCTQAELVDDLELLFLCGLHPYTPDVLIEVDIVDGRVWIRYADYFSRPLRLTPAEGLALLAAGRTVLAASGGDDGGPLARGLDKLAAVLGVDAGEAVEIELGPVAEDLLQTLRAAAGQSRQVEIDYYSFGRDARARRVIDPYAVFSAGGQWYVAGWCHRVDDERLFRVDRIAGATLLGSSFDRPGKAPELAAYRPAPEDPRVTLDLDPSARWVVEQYPVEKVEELDGGRLRVTLVASQPAWLERLLLRLGPRATVVSGDGGVAAGAARRLLARYQG
ncbi:MAG TPA: WYL domain-containing protein [Acidimicrobiales bacterium]|nr:WYL domain-containing protein [Acidimicrobiales bacterium]